MFEVYGRNGQVMIETNSEVQALQYLKDFPDAAFVLEYKTVTRFVATKEGVERGSQENGPG